MTNRLILRILIFCVFLTFTPEIKAQRYFRNFTSNMGLCDNTITAISQDNNGFIWLGTFNGLCRFDGLLFTTFRHSQGDHGTLSSNIIRDIQPDAHGLWIATEAGLDFHSFADGIFHHCRTTKKIFDFRFNRMVRTGNRLYAVDNGQNIYAYRGNYLFEQLHIFDSKIRDLTPCAHGMLAAVGEDGIYLLSNDLRRTIDHLPYKIRTSALTRIFYSKTSGLIYVANGIGHPSMVFSINGNRIRKTGAYVPNSLMSVADYRDRTTFGIDGGGIILEDRDGQRQCYKPENSNISGDAVYSLFTDKSGDLWVGSYRDGLNLMSESFQWFTLASKNNKKLSYDIVTAVVTTPDNLYLGLDGGGLEVIDKKTCKSHTYTTGNSNLPANNIVSMFRDGDKLWMGVYSKGLVCFSLSTHQFTTYPMPNADFDANNVWTITDDGHGYIWIGGPMIFVFNKHTHKIKYIATLERADCTAMTVKDDYIWIATRYNGIFKINSRTQRITRHYTSKSKTTPLPNDTIKYVFMDSHDRLWFSTEYNGLFAMNEHECKWHHYGADEGLTAQNVYSMMEDRRRYIWMGSNKGLFRFDPKTHAFIRFDVDENLSEYTYNGCAYDGTTMYFGNTKGLVSFDPESVKPRQIHNMVSFNSLELINSNHEVFNLYHTNEEKITLAYNQNFFTIRFSVPELVSPNRVHFSCYLKGLETQWRELIDAREVSYTNISYGTYEFYVRCTDLNGRWGKPSILHIVITPPWYATWWAKLLWVLILLTIAYLSARVYLHNLEMKHQVKIKEIEKRSMEQLNEAKINFYTNITHELRTPMFLITAPLEEMLASTLRPLQVPYSYVQRMYRNAIRINRLINRILDIRKMESSTMELNIQHLNIVELCRRLSIDYLALCNQKEITFRLISPKHTVDMDIDVEKVELILSNLISNAYKYTDKGGTVKLIVEDKDKTVELKVQDNGIGISNKELDKIFRQFYRVKDTTEVEGSGIGLSFVKSLVQSHGGEINVVSKIGKGSEFTVSLPKIQQKKEVKKFESVVIEQEQKDTENILPVSENLQSPAATKTILIIDDEEETREILERYLSRTYLIIQASDGEIGLKIAEEQSPDLIICDVMMPNIDGFAFLSFLKENKKMANIPVIMLTGKTMDEDKISAYKYGADDYIIKPVSLKYLQARIENLLAKNPVLTVNDQQKRYTKEEQTFILNCKSIIDDNINNGMLNVSFMAEQMQMGYSSFYKKIKSITGLSVMEFINDYRIFKAVQLFKDGETNVTNVAEKCGFNDASSFRAAFKNKMGMSPKQYVQRL